MFLVSVLVNLNLNFLVWFLYSFWSYLRPPGYWKLTFVSSLPLILHSKDVVVVAVFVVGLVVVGLVAVVIVVVVDHRNLNLKFDQYRVNNK